MPDRRDELLKQADGRYFAIDIVGTGLGSLATTELIQKRLVGFSLPSGPALFLHLAHRAFQELGTIDSGALFDEHVEGRWPEDHGPLFDFLETSIAHVVFAFTAIEAFANEAIPDKYVYLRTRRDGEQESLDKEATERRCSLDEKLVDVLPNALSVTNPKTLKVWQHYVALRKTRDRLIHLKTQDRKSSGPDEETIWGILVKRHREPWCDYAHEVIGHFSPAINGRRWYRLYPYD